MKIFFLGIPEAVMATTYNANSHIELQKLFNVSQNLTPYNGGDVPERQFRTLLTILSLNDSSGLKVMIPGSEIVLLTDATSHDPELESNITAKAREMKVCISFYVSHREPWPPYNRIANQTGGAITNSINHESFHNFDHEHDYGQCGRFYKLNPPSISSRKKRATITTSFDIEQRCHYFTTSSLTTSLTVQGFTSQAAMIVRKPNSEKVRVITDIEGDKVYHDQAPVAGQWSVCVETGTISVLLDITDRIGSNLRFMKPTRDSFSLHTSPPSTACKYN